MKRLFSGIALACFLAVPAFAGDTGRTSARPPLELEGRCTYSDRLAPLREQNHFFVECDRMETRDLDGQVVFKFAFPARLRSLELRGTYVREGRFKVSAIRLRSQRDWDEAEGHCDLNLSESNDYTVTCLVKDGPRFFVVNFTLGA